MATTTEPPYLHKSSGVAARTGTTTHTITFSTDGDAPFTPATGSLLAVYVFGAVTHSTTGSWTEQAQPVSSGELSLFTSTNNSSTAPPSSITITHNGSNYPMPFCVIEFPAGSVHVGSQGDNASNDTFAALTGLSGAAMVIVGAKGRVATGTETTASSVWTAPWVEDADLFTPNASATDGGYLTVGHQINVTTTSVTPATTTTYTGTWPVADREKISSAFNVAATSSTTPVTGSMDLRWQVRTLVTGSSDLRWQVSNVVTSGSDLRWQVRSVVAPSSLDVRWQVSSAVSQSSDLRWIVLNAVTSSSDLRWQVRTVVTGSLDARWQVSGTVSSGLDVRWQVLATVPASSVDLRWQVRSAVSSSVDLRWQVWNVVTAPMDLRWSVGDGVVSLLDLRWQVLSAVSATLDARWQVLALASRSLDLRWTAFALVSSPLDLQWSVAGKPSASIDLQWTVANAVSGTLDLRWGVTSQISGSLQLLWITRSRTASPLALLWQVEGSGVRLVAMAVANLTDRFTVYPEQDAIRADLVER